MNHLAKRILIRNQSVMPLMGRPSCSGANIDHQTSYRAARKGSLARRSRYQDHGREAVPAGVCSGAMAVATQKPLWRNQGAKGSLAAARWAG